MSDKPMTQACFECGADIVAPNDSQIGEIFSCPDCGIDYVIVEEENGLKHIQELNLEEEDWGE